MSLNLDKNLYLNGYKNKDKAILARFLSLLESSQSSHQKFSLEIFKKFKIKKCPVIGISGTPGAGKSTFINQLGMSLLKKNKKLKLAIIAIDPTSEITGGSILGDKTRMGELSHHHHVFIRPIASKGTFGGVTPRIQLMIKALMAWDFNLILIETVGVGQSESTIRSVVDKLMLIVPPGTGDDLQAMKRGLLELIDVICINKIDLSSKQLVQSSYDHYKGSLSILRSIEIPIFLTNANSIKGIRDVTDWILKSIVEINRQLLSKKQNMNSDYLKKLYDLELQQKFTYWFKNTIHKKNTLEESDSIFKEFGKYLIKE